MNELTDLVVTHAAAFALIVTRLSGFIVVSPFPGANVNATVRIGVVLLLGWVVTLFAPTGLAPHELGLDMVPLSLSEFGCGLAIGGVFRFMFAAAEVLGQVAAQATGISVPQVLNPATETQDSAIGHALSLMAMLIVLATGTHRVVLGYLLESFRALPVGSPMVLAATAPTFVDLSFEAFKVGVQLAMPVIAVGLVVQTALALLSRAAPSLQIFSVGLGLVLVCGFGTLLASLPDIDSGLAAHFAHMAPRMERVIGALRGGPP